MSREPIQKQDVVAQTQPVVSSCTRIPNVNHNWNGNRIATALVPWRCLYVDSNCSVLSSNLSTACVLFSGTATPALTTNFSDTCSFSPKFNESVTCFTVPYSEQVFAERLCTIPNATITLQWRSRSVYAHWKTPTIFTVHCRPDQC